MIRSPDAASRESPEAPSYRRLRAGGRGVSVVDSGVGEPVVFLHGNPSWSFSFRHQIRALSGEYRVVAPDLLGFGGSEPLRGGASFVDQADMFERILETMNLGRVRLVLHDWGGPIGLRWGVRHPDRVARLVMSNTTASSAFLPPAYWAPLLAPRLGELLVVHLNLFAVGLPMVMRAARDAQVWAAYRDGFRSRESRRAVLRLERLDGFQAVVKEVEAGLGALTAPTLVIWGEPDPYFGRGDREELSRRLPNAEVELVPGGGHFPFEDQPERVTRLLRDFLQREDSREPS